MPLHQICHANTIRGLFLGYYMGSTEYCEDLDTASIILAFRKRFKVLEEEFSEEWFDNILKECLKLGY